MAFKMCLTGLGLSLLRIIMNFPLEGATLVGFIDTQTQFRDEVHRLTGLTGILKS
jgi:hypothetical protein